MPETIGMEADERSRIIRIPLRKPFSLFPIFEGEVPSATLRAGM